MQAIVDSSDGDLARAVAARKTGEAEAAESELYRRFGPRVRLYGRRHLRDEDAALDLMQQVMLMTIEKLRSGAVRDADQIASFVLGVSFYAERTASEVARELSLKEGNVRVIRHRAVERLRACMTAGQVAQ